MISLELLNDAVNDIHKAKMEIGKVVYDAETIRREFERLVDDEDAKLFATENTNIDEVFVYVNRIKEAEQCGALVEKMHGNGYTAKSFHNFICNNPRPNNVIFDRDDRIVDFRYNGVSISIFRTDEYNRNNVYKYICSSVIENCYNYFLKNDELVQLNKKCLDLYHKIKYMVNMDGFVWSSVNRGSLLKWKNDRTHKMTEDEMKDFIYKAEKIIEYANSISFTD